MLLPFIKAIKLIDYDSLKVIVSSRNSLRDVLVKRVYT